MNSVLWCKIAIASLFSLQHDDLDTKFKVDDNNGAQSSLINDDCALSKSLNILTSNLIIISKL